MFSYKFSRKVLKYKRNSHIKNNRRILYYSPIIYFKNFIKSSLDTLAYKKKLHIK